MITTIYHTRMNLDRRDVLRLKTKRVYEKTESDLVSSIICPGDVFVDIGAHIGYYSMIAGRFVGSLGVVFAFEPEAENFSILAENVKLNEFKNVFPINMAISDRSGVGNLFLNDQSSGDHRIYPSGKRSRMVCHITTIDEFFDKIEKISFIKIDVQGAEWRALAGAVKTLPRVPLMMVEFYPPGIIESGGDPNRYLDQLRESGFRIGEIDRYGRGILPFSNQELIAKYPVKIGRHCNLWCAR